MICFSCVGLGLLVRNFCKVVFSVVLVLVLLMFGLGISEIVKVVGLIDSLL